MLALAATLEGLVVRDGRQIGQYRFREKERVVPDLGSLGVEDGSLDQFVDEVTLPPGLHHPAEQGGYGLAGKLELLAEVDFSAFDGALSQQGAGIAVQVLQEVLSSIDTPTEHSHDILGIGKVIVDFAFLLAVHPKEAEVLVDTEPEPVAQGNGRQRYLGSPGSFL